jgi:hypothetical protein
LLRVLEKRGILHDSQSGFRSNFRLQSRVLLLIDQISSLMSTSAPTATVFIDFKQAFDNIWWSGCLGKLSQLGIPIKYVLWIESWSKGRLGFIELNNKRSRLFNIYKGGPQGSCLTPAVFITYHSDMWTFLESSMPNFFADDLACVLGGRLGVKYSLQCLDLERKLKKFFEYLEYYSILSLQPINYDKTEALWTARAIGNPKFDIHMGDHKIAWVKDFRYLGYHLSCKLGWNKMISIYKTKIRQRVAIIKSCKMYGSSSAKFRRTLFSAYVRPLFTWLFAIFPLFTDLQKDDLSHFYMTCLKRTLRSPYWNDVIFASLTGEKTLENLCHSYWKRYKMALLQTTDGSLLFEQYNFNLFRSLWIDRSYQVKYIRRSRRIVTHHSTIEKCFDWYNNSCESSILDIPFDDFELLMLYPELFV